MKCFCAVIINIFLLIPSFIANAGLIQVQDNIVNNQYISGSNSGVFDLNDLLAFDTDYIVPYDINSATIRFIFSDDASDSIFDQSYIVNEKVPTGPYYSCGDLCWRRTQLEYHYDTDREEYDYAAIITGDGEFRADSEFDNIYNGYTTTHVDTSLWQSPSFNKYTEYYVRTIHNMNDYGHTDWIFDMTLSASALDILSATGMFSFEIEALDNTDFLLSSAIMTVDINENPVSVPESSTLAIFALGMIGLASRRFKIQS